MDPAAWAKTARAAFPEAAWVAVGLVQVVVENGPVGGQHDEPTARTRDDERRPGRRGDHGGRRPVAGAAGSRIKRLNPPARLIVKLLDHTRVKPNLIMETDNEQRPTVKREQHY